MKCIKEEWWSSDYVRNAERQKTNLICNVCQADGFTARDPQGLFECKACPPLSKHHARGQFKPKALKNAAQRPDYSLVCLRCTEREKDLIRTLQVKKGPRKAYLCTCKCPVHIDKCDVFRRWPGYNVGVTIEELRFLKFRPANVKRFNL